jgi:hypothetical protein
MTGRHLSTVEVAGSAAREQSPQPHSDSIGVFGAADIGDGYGAVARAGRMGAVIVAGRLIPTKMRRQTPRPAGADLENRLRSSENTAALQSSESATKPCKWRARRAKIGK